MATAVEELIDHHPLPVRSKLRLAGIAAICCVAVIFDGFDLQALAVGVPLIAKEWGIAPVQLGALSSITFVGLLVGAISMGMMGDRWGRRKTLALGILGFAFFMGTAAFAQNYAQLAVLRFLAGLGMGGVLPTAILILSELFPRRMRARMIGIGAGSFTVGLVVAPAVARLVVPAYGWRPLFGLSYLAGAVALLALLFVPESPKLLVSKGRIPEARAVLRRLYPGIDEQIADGRIDLAAMASTGATAPRAGFGALWIGSHRAVTVALSILFILIQFVLSAMNFWTVSLLVRHGESLQSSYSYATIAPAAGILGMLAMGWILDRSNPYIALGIAFSLGGLALMLFGILGPSAGAYASYAAAGALLQGVQTTVHLLVVNAYRTELKATGLGWANGIGRLGAMLAPVVGGYLITLNPPFALYFVIFGMPAILCSIVILVLYRLQLRNPEIAPEDADRSMPAVAPPPAGVGD